MVPPRSVSDTSVRRFPSPCPCRAGGLLKPTDLHGDTLCLCTSQTMGSIREGPPHVYKEHTHTISINRVQVSHSFLNAAFQVHVPPRSLDLLLFVNYAIYSPTAPRRQGCVPADPSPFAHAAAFPSSVPPKTLAEGQAPGEERELRGLAAQAGVRPWHSSWRRHSRATRG